MLRIFAVSFVFGFLSVGLLLLSFAIGLAIIADVRGWGSISVGSGMLTILEYDPTAEGTETVIGTGTFAISFLAGLMNAVAGTILWSRVSKGR
jgi:hypothetical protein